MKKDAGGPQHRVLGHAADEALQLAPPGLNEVLFKATLDLLVGDGWYVDAREESDQAGVQPGEMLEAPCHGRAGCLRCQSEPTFANTVLHTSYVVKCLIPEYLLGR
jgi:hypothetical protein